MTKKILSMLMLVTVVICSYSNTVLAAQNKVEEDIVNLIEERQEEKYEKLINGEFIESEDEKLDEAYMNLEITLPDEYIYDEEINTNLDDSISMIATYSTNTIPDGICTSGTATNTDLVFTMNGALNSYYDIYNDGVTTSYRFGSKLSDSFVLPGMDTTNVRGASCEKMIPQGIEYAKGYFFITAYCSAKEHNSVIYVVDSSTKKYITTLVLAQTFHAGGITYANNCLWICSGYDNDNQNAIIYYYKIAPIIEAIEYAKSNSNVKSIYLGSYTYGKVYLEDQSKCSFISSYNGNLCVGEYYEDQIGGLGFYPANPTNGITLSATKAYVIPEKAQGVAFYSTTSNVYMLITSSCGVVNNSKVYVYSSSNGQLSGTLKCTKKIEMPCMVEEALVYGGRTYFVFESCGYSWRTKIAALYVGVGTTPEIVGKVCGFNNSFIYK